MRKASILAGLLLAFCAASAKAGCLAGSCGVASVAVAAPVAVNFAAPVAAFAAAPVYAAPVAVAAVPSVAVAAAPVVVQQNVKVRAVRARPTKVKVKVR